MLLIENKTRAQVYCCKELRVRFFCSTERNKKKLSATSCYTGAKRPRELPNGGQVRSVCSSGNLTAPRNITSCLASTPFINWCHDWVTDFSFSFRTPWTTFNRKKRRLEKLKKKNHSRKKWKEPWENKQERKEDNSHDMLKNWGQTVSNCRFSQVIWSFCGPEGKLKKFHLIRSKKRNR